MLKRVLALWLATSLAVLAAPDLGELTVKAVLEETEAPVKGAVVRVLRKDKRQVLSEGSTDEAGEARLRDVPFGEYYVEVRSADGLVDGAYTVVSPGGENLFEAYLVEGTAEDTLVIRDGRLLVRGNDPGASTVRDADFLERLTDRSSLPSVLATVPGTASNSLGQVHVRGEHRALSLSLDGVDLPLATAGSTTAPLDPEFLQSVEVKTGGYDSSRGGQTGAVIDATTPGKGEKPFAQLTAKTGNLGQSELVLKAGGSNEDNTFHYFVGARRSTSDVYLEAPTPTKQDLDNSGELLSFLVRLGANQPGNEYGLTISHQNADFGIPQTPANFDAGVRQSQQDSNTLIMGSWRHELTPDDSLMMALALQRNEQRVRNNGVFTPYVTMPDFLQPELSADGFPLNPESPGSPYLPTTDLSITQIKPSLDYLHEFSADHLLKAGLTANFIQSDQRLDITDPGNGGSLPNPVGFGDARELRASIARDAMTLGLYLDHTYPLCDSLVLNYGLRADYFDNGINITTGQLSPRFNLAYSPTEKQALRLSYNRLFQPPPIELDVSGQTEVLPQRTHMYELSYENQIADRVVAKAALVYKDFQDQVDIGLLIPNSNIPVFAPVNFARAKYQGLELSVNTTNDTGWNGFVSFTLSEARPLEGSLFTGPPPEYNDHDQRVQTTAGASYTWENGLTVGGDILYASGFPQVGLPLYNAIGIAPFGFSGDRVSRFITNLNLNYEPDPDAQGASLGASLQVFNLFDDRSLVNLFSEFSGSRFVTGRRFLLGLNARF